MSDKKNSITIKKYANRRLYNTATSTYVTLEDLSVMVKNNEDFNVFDAKSSEDITRSVLAQIIMDEENKSGQQNLLPTSFLRQLIGFYGNNLQWMVPKYLEHSMETLSGNQEQIQDYFKTTLGSMFPFGTTFEEMSKQNLSMFENTMRMLSPFGTGLGSNLPSAAPVVAPAAKTACASKKPTQAKASSKAAPKAASKPSCSLSSKKAPCAPTKVETKAPAKPVQKKKEESNVASITNLTPKKEKAAKKSKPSSKSQADTPMPNVANAAAASSAGADDMQQKIANLQRQLADLAKSRA